MSVTARDSCLLVLPTLIPALPFAKSTMKVERRIAGYPLVLNTLGDHLQKRRLDLGLQWKQVAEQIGTDDSCVAYWRTGQTKPGLRLWPGVIRFLGYDPRPEPVTIGERLVWQREGFGLSQKEMASQLRVDPSTLAKWERGERSPAGLFRKRVENSFEPRARHGAL